MIYAKALLSFARERSNDATEMKRLLAESPEHNEPARALAHALKGAAGNLVLQRIADLATEIDAALKMGLRDKALPLLRELDNSLEEAAAAGKLLEQLSVAMDELAPEVIEPILALLADYVAPSDLAPINKSVEAFDFDEAQTKALALAKKLGVTL